MLLESPSMSCWLVDAAAVEEAIYSQCMQTLENLSVEASHKPSSTFKVQHKPTFDMRDKQLSLPHFCHWNHTVCNRATSSLGWCLRQRYMQVAPGLAIKAASANTGRRWCFYSRSLLSQAPHTGAYISVGPFRLSDATLWQCTHIKNLLLTLPHSLHKHIE